MTVRTAKGSRPTPVEKWFCAVRNLTLQVVALLFSVFFPRGMQAGVVRSRGQSQIDWSV
ncbi:hypothetical protein IXB28_02560 [Leptothoe kymatousa TAU-MAC 1615]|uniref:Uncharacterized protein n=1 Tax=Leptothoe kymatousa TAU-MAC 1615 TaxID=2364775 RepID=A0ABS5XZR5_9CYAN|nr:hypothetical protein [Leptothoe kymatousa TAU-MAC 1615]